MTSLFPYGLPAVAHASVGPDNRTRWVDQAWALLYEPDRPPESWRRTDHIENYDLRHPSRAEWLQAYLQGQSGVATMRAGNYLLAGDTAWALEQGIDPRPRPRFWSIVPQPDVGGVLITIIDIEAMLHALRQAVPEHVALQGGQSG